MNTIKLNTMKTIYSLREFYNSVKELAAKEPKTDNYFTISVEIGFEPNDVKFRVYVHEVGSAVANSPDECLEQMRNKMFPVTKAENEIDVLIEVDGNE